MAGRLAIAATLMLCTGPVAMAAAQRAIWTWEQPSYDMVRDPDNAAAAFAFLRAQHIDVIYLYADTFQGENLLTTRPELYRQFVSHAHRQGLRVYALLGSAYLHSEGMILPERRAEALAMVERVLAFNKASRSHERFDGINLDIEPHVLDEWPEKQLELLGLYLDLGQALMDLKRSSGQTLLVGPAIPFWFDGIALNWHGRTAPVSEHVIDIYDYATLMDYRDHAAGDDGIIGNAADEMAYAARTHKHIVIGVHVSPDEIQKTSFNHLAEADLERELALTAKAFKNNPAFAGFAIHHFRTYQEWLARGPLATKAN